jgi:hypothetical protein
MWNHALVRETNLIQNGSIGRWKDLGDIREHFTCEEEKVLKKIRFWESSEVEEQWKDAEEGMQEMKRMRQKQVLRLKRDLGDLTEKKEMELKVARRRPCCETAFCCVFPSKA